MKSIKEKQFLVNMAVALGQSPDPALVKEIDEHNKLMESITVKGDEFGSLLNQLAQLKDEVETVKQVAEVKHQYFKPKEIPKEYPKPPTLEEVMAMAQIEDTEPVNKSQTEDQIEQIEETVKEELSPLIVAASSHITKEVQMEANSFQQPEPTDPILRSVEDLKKKIKFLEGWISKISMTGPGSGEVNLLKLDDVDTSAIGNGKFLRYNEANAKIEFATVSGGGGGSVDTVNGQTGNVVLTTSDISEGSNQYYTNSKVYSNVTSIGYASNTSVALKANIVDLTTANVTELTNLYFTNARVYSNVTQLGYITSSSLNGYATNSQVNGFATTTNLELKANVVDLTTANVTELTNLYFTNARVYSNVTSLGYITSSSLSGYTTNTQLSSYATNAQLATYATNAQLTSYATTANTLSQFASTTSAQLASIISDETGTGNLVFSISPTFTGTLSAAEISATGNITSPYFYSQSDINLKKDLVRVTNALDIVKLLDGYWFKWKDTDADSIGLIAQYVERVLPMLIGTAPDGSKTVLYNGIIAILLEAIKAQQVQIDEIKAKLNG